MANSKRQNLKGKRRNNSHSVEQKKGRSFRGCFLAFLTGGALVTALFFAFGGNFIKEKDNQFNAPLLNLSQSFAGTPVVSKPSNIRSLHQLLALSPEELENVDIGLMNLLCAQDLGIDIDVESDLKKLDEWAEVIKQDVAQRIGNYEINPAKYDYSKAKCLMVNLILGLKEIYGLKYDMKLMRDADYSDGKQVFIHGILGKKRSGSCASFPAFYAAIARRLDLPVKLVLAQGHYLMRWDDPVTGEVFNIDASGPGMDFPPDKHYMEYPYVVTKSCIERGYYLHSLNSTETLAAFMQARGDVLKSQKRNTEAMVAYAHSYRLWPLHANQLLGLGSTVDAEFQKISNLDFQVDKKRIRYFACPGIRPEDALATWCWPPMTREELLKYHHQLEQKAQADRAAHPEYDAFLKELGR